MEGILLVPPERGTIIGRALWKPRFVTVGPGYRDRESNLPSPQIPGSSRPNAVRNSSTRSQPRGQPDGIYLSIFKSKDDVDPVQQHAVSSITECQVQMLAHRKQGPVLPTLVMNISPDPATDKLRKRRSSRTVGLTSTREANPSMLWFRLPSDAEYSLQDWVRFITRFVQPHVPDRPPMSPITPASPTFVNPFGSRPRDTAETFPRPSSGNANLRAALQHKASNQTHSSRERPVTFSESPSLRSRRSDVSSHASSTNPPFAAFQNYTTVYPTDLPSPATTVGEYQGEFIEGWTSAQGRSSTISSPVRGRDSIGSQQPVVFGQPGIEPGSPLIPRETILDRAFQMRCIPGSDREVPGEEKLSSLARFEALMREADDRRKLREAETARPNAAAVAVAAASATVDEGMKSAWDIDEESDSDDQDADEDEEEDDEDDGNDESDVDVLETEQHEHPDDRYMMPPTAQRALDYIQGRREARNQAEQARLSYNPETLMTLNSGSPHPRPQTGYSRNRPGIAQRTHSQPHLAAALPAPRVAHDVHVPSRGDSALLVDNTNRPTITASSTLVAAQPSRVTADKRQSGASAKRLSFTEFTKRLSTTSSLLLAPANNVGGAGGAASRNGEVVDPQQQHQHQQPARGILNPRAAPPSQPPPSECELEGSDKRCAWRGSVGVFGGEGGFL